MPLSRLRLQLSAGFALAFVAALTVLNILLYLFITHQESERLGRELTTVAAELVQSIQAERGEGRDTSLSSAAREALTEWPANGVGFVAFAADGRSLGHTGPQRLVAAVPESLIAERIPSLRFVRFVVNREAAAAGGPIVVAAGSTFRLHEDRETLAIWMLLSTPAALLLSLVLGYFLSRYAISPLIGLGAAVEAMTPDDLGGRLPVRSPPDELDQLAAHFNRLLDRLRAAREQNQNFLRRAAHQLRTPLTLVLGESQLSLDRPRSPEEQVATLRRIRTAAEQMTHRVTDLFLLASVQAGERLPLHELVELDGLVAEAADLMRGRAQALSRRLELGEIQPAELMGDERLLREAVVELLENACRHGTDARPVMLELTTQGGLARITVTNAGPPLPDHWGRSPENTTPEAELRGLGLSIVRWIAAAHGGTLEAGRDGDFNRLILSIPLGRTSTGG